MIQYLFPPCSTGPSSNTCPKWLPLAFTSVLVVLWEVSSCSDTKFSSIVLVKDGHPVQESNLSVEEKSGVPSIIST